MSAGTETTKRMSGAERREQLLDATKSIVDERGFHAASIEAVAREAGITRPVVYGHFGDLVRPGLAPGREPPDPELAARGLSAFADELARRLLTDPDSYPRERLVAFARWILDSIVAPGRPDARDKR